MSTVMYSNSSKPIENNKANQGICNGMPWSNKWAEDITGNISPIKGDRNQRKASDTTK